jgi:XTP/dITP diphosphohydrolase
MAVLACKAMRQLRGDCPSKVRVKVDRKFDTCSVGGFCTHDRGDMDAAMKIRFLSGNPFKIAEVKQILAPQGIEAIAVTYKIDEIQTTDVEALLRDKAIKAFQHIGRSLFVEHTGLYAEALNNFPGGLTQVFWDTLGPDRVAALFQALGNPRVTAKTHIAYIDGKKIRIFEGAVSGSFAETPRGCREFQWDCVFIPDGATNTFAEMGTDAKNEISMRKKALDAFAPSVTGR